jgi:hypothetical protein
VAGEPGPAGKPGDTGAATATATAAIPATSTGSVDGATASRDAVDRTDRPGVAASGDRPGRAPRDDAAAVAAAPPAGPRSDDASTAGRRPVDLASADAQDGPWRPATRPAGTPTTAPGDRPAVGTHAPVPTPVPTAATATATATGTGTGTGTGPNTAAPWPVQPDGGRADRAGWYDGHHGSGAPLGAHRSDGVTDGDDAAGHRGGRPVSVPVPQPAAPAIDLGHRAPPGADRSGQDADDAGRGFSWRRATGAFRRVRRDGGRPADPAADGGRRTGHGTEAVPAHDEEYVDWVSGLAGDRDRPRD